jgi:hypothetical protein
MNTTTTETGKAVEAGKTVHWATQSYRVVKDEVGQWLIVCDLNNHAIGLTWRDGVTMNGEPKDFFVVG